MGRVCTDGILSWLSSKACPRSRKVAFGPSSVMRCGPNKRPVPRDTLSKPIVICVRQLRTLCAIGFGTALPAATLGTSWCRLRCRRGRPRPTTL
eukprot:9319112-Pyramimonas_sp.AAC.1